MSIYPIRLCAVFSILTWMVLCLACTTTPQPQNANATPNPQPQPAKQVGAPEGFIDDVTGEGKVGGRLTVTGWAADMEDGAPVKRVEVLIDNNVAAQATLGKIRADVVKVSGRADWQQAGWEASVPLDNIPPGRHTIAAAAYDSAGVKGTLSGARVIEIEAK